MTTEQTTASTYGTPYKGGEKYAHLVIPYLKHNNIRCRKYEWIAMNGKEDRVKIDGKIRTFHVDTKEETFHKKTF